MPSKRQLPKLSRPADPQRVEVEQINAEAVEPTRTLTIDEKLDRILAQQAYIIMQLSRR